MEAIVGLIIGILIAAVISGVVIWIVSRFNVGLSVDNFGWAMLAGLFIGAITSLINSFVPGMEGIIAAVVHLVVSAAVILLAGKVFSGVKVDGFKGALIAAIVMAIVSLVLILALGGTAALIGAAGQGAAQ
jgi:putative membrane protein